MVTVEVKSETTATVVIVSKHIKQTHVSVDVDAARAFATIFSKELSDANSWRVISCDGKYHVSYKSDMVTDDASECSDDDAWKYLEVSRGIVDV